MKAKARSSILTNKSVARTASSAAEQLHYTRPKKDSVCSDSIQKWVYWWASNYASPGLTVLGRRSPGLPAPAQAGTRGAIKASQLIEERRSILRQEGAIEFIKCDRPKARNGIASTIGNRQPITDELQPSHIRYARRILLKMFYARDAVGPTAADDIAVASEYSAFWPAQEGQQA